MRTRVSIFVGLDLTSKGLLVIMEVIEQIEKHVFQKMLQRHDFQTPQFDSSSFTTQYRPHPTLYRRLATLALLTTNYGVPHKQTNLAHTNPH